jgi:hypothetical protein
VSRTSGLRRFLYFFRKRREGRKGKKKKKRGRKKKKERSGKREKGWGYVKLFFHLQNDFFFFF